MVRVVGRAVSRDLGVDPRAARLRAFLRLEHQRAGAFADDETVARGIERAGCRRRIGVLGQRGHLGECGDRQRHRRVLGPATYRQVHQPVADHAVGLAYSVGPRSAGGHRAEVRARELEHHGDVARSRVAHQHRNHERADPLGSLLHDDVVLCDDGVDASDARGEDDAAALGFDLRVAGVLPGELRSRNSEVNERVGAFGFLGLHELRYIEVQDLAGEFHRQVVGLEALDGEDAAATGGQAFPEGVDSDADWSDRSYAGDDDLAGLDQVARLDQVGLSRASPSRGQRPGRRS